MDQIKAQQVLKKDTGNLPVLNNKKRDLKVMITPNLWFHKNNILF